MTPLVHDAHPPAAVAAVLDPIMRTLLRTPAGRLLPDLAIIEFTGRRSGRRYRVPVGWHDLDGVAVVFTPAPWRCNFSHSAAARVHHRGSTHSVIGTLVTDAAAVTQALQHVLDAETSPRRLGLQMPPDHALTESDITTVHRAMIQFAPVATTPPVVEVRSAS